MALPWFGLHLPNYTFDDTLDKYVACDRERSDGSICPARLRPRR